MEKRKYAILAAVTFVAFAAVISIADILLVCPENRVAQQYFTAVQHILSDSAQ